LWSFFHSETRAKLRPWARCADITAVRAGIRVCVEVKAVTKQSRGRENLFLEEQLYEKIREHAHKASRQLAISAERLSCRVRPIAYVVNWFEQSIYLSETDYQQIVNKLEKHGEVESLIGIDGILFVTKIGQEFLFLNDIGKQIDVGH
jgi:Holliday junction resolvase